MPDKLRLPTGETPAPIAPPPDPPPAPEGDITPSFEPPAEPTPEPPAPPTPEEERIQRILAQHGSDPVALARQVANAESLIGQRNEDAILGRTIREKGFPGQQAPEPPPPDMSAQVAAQREADINSLTQEILDTELSLVYEDTSDERVQQIARVQARSRMAERERFYGPIQMLAGIVNKTMAKTALQEEVVRYIPQGMTVTPEETAAELSAMMGDSFDILQWGFVPPELQSRLGRLAAFEADLKKRTAPRPSDPPVTRRTANTPTPEPSIRGTESPMPVASRYANDPRLNVVKTQLMTRWPGWSEEEYTQHAMEDLAYRDKYAKGGG